MNNQQEKQVTEKIMTLRDTIAPKSDQLNFDDVAISPVTVRVVKMAMGSAEQPVIVNICNAETGEPMRDFKPCKTVRRVLIKAWGEKGRDWIGKRMTLYGDQAVKYGGAEVGGIRVSHVSGITAPLRLMLTQSRGRKNETIIQVLPEIKTEQEA